jgi:microsomal dipeptidase-like Zn-dependent dipeptidase
VSDDSALSGFADLHNHQFADLAFGGHVVYGAPGGELVDLASCRRRHGPHGLLDLIGNASTMVLGGSGAQALLGHGTRGWPDFTAWPRWDSFSHQGVHQTWLRRAVDGGLRLMVMLAVHNTLLCRATRGPWHRPCATLDAVEVQLSAARALEASIDEQCGGPGLGWYRIVDSPDAAAEVVARGHLAVVLGAEVDDLFGFAGDAEVDDGAIGAIVDRCLELGLRHLVPIHFADNGMGGAAFQVLSWAKGHRPLSPANPWGSFPLYRIQSVDGSAAGYAYRGGRVNALGLTLAGRRLLRRLMRRGLVIDVDHMSARARSETLDIAENLHKPVVSGHAEFGMLSGRDQRSERQLTDADLARIVELGGIVAPILRQTSLDPALVGSGDPVDTARGFMAAYLYAVRHAAGGAVALGSDLNGFAGGTRPRFPGGQDEHESRVNYPFPSPLPDGPMLGRAVAGSRAFDINLDGLAHVGMLPDLIAELQALGTGPQLLRPLMRSAEAYVQVWRACAS